jgi:acyl dehydratase
MSATTAIPSKPVALNEGSTGPEVTIGPITRTDIVRYAGASGDFNPIHHDEEFAKAAGMPSVFSHGLLTAGLVGQYLARWVGLTHVKSFGVRFTGQVWPGDTLTLGGRVVAVNESENERLAQIELTATRQTGEVVVTGRAEARVG